MRIEIAASERIGAPKCSSRKGRQSARREFSPAPHFASVAHTYASERSAVIQSDELAHTDGH